MNKRSLSEIVRDRFYSSSGKEFQRLFWKIFIKVFPDLQTPEMNHDLGNDGYSIKAQTFFAVYAPESGKYDNKITKKKISNPKPQKSEESGDYEKFSNNWKNKFKFAIWIFVTKENLKGLPHQMIAELNQNGDGITKQHWGMEQLVEKTMSLDEKTIRDLFGLDENVSVNNQYNDVGIVNNGDTHVGKQAKTINEYHYENGEEDENTAIDEIFDYVISRLPQTPVIVPNDDKQIKVNAKIKLNFSEKKDQEEVEKYFVSAYTRTNLIEGRLQALDPIQQDDIQLHILQKYNEFKRNSKSSIETLDKLFAFFTPKKRERNSTFVAVVRAFVLLYFEDCTIFEKE